MSSVVYERGLNLFDHINGFDSLFLHFETFDKDIKIYGCDPDRDERRETVSLTDKSVFFVANAHNHKPFMEWQNKLSEQYPKHVKYDSSVFFSINPAVHSFHSDHESVHIVGLFGKTVYRIYSDDDVEDYLVEKGDYINIPKHVPHMAISITPRAILSTGFYE